MGSAKNLRIKSANAYFALGFQSESYARDTFRLPFASMEYPARDSLARSHFGVA